MISTKIAKDNAQIELFKKLYYESSSNHVDIEYLKRASIVRFFYDKHGNPIAGYVLNGNIPHRYLSDIPSERFDTCNIPPKDNMVEGCCIWMNRGLNSFGRGIIYIVTFYDYCMLGKRFMMGASVEPKVASLQKKVIPNVVYEGPIKHAPWCSMYFGTRRHMIWLTLFVVGNYWFVKPLKNKLTVFRRKLLSEA
ncbi:hypothetical protein [Zooshikella ganghwensis]|uniref:hypothetical protein n=1 Tax=Zooshikella ganghwensis TaxID=202772 RepID=UPI00040BD208|nr:hypothetical protein [Zooshikella ganghwensis]